MSEGIGRVPQCSPERTWAEKDGRSPTIAFALSPDESHIRGSIAESLRPVYRYPAMVFADLDLSCRLERAEGQACLEFAESRHRLHPESGAAWMQCAGANVVFDGVDSPITQTFGLGLFEPLLPESLDRIERFFQNRGAAVAHEVSPLAGIPTLDLLCARGYRPIELNSVMYRPVDRPGIKENS